MGCCSLCQNWSVFGCCVPKGCIHYKTDSYKKDSYKTTVDKLIERYGFTEYRYCSPIKKYYYTFKEPLIDFGVRKRSKIDGITAKKSGDIVRIVDGSYNEVVQPDGSVEHEIGLALYDAHYVVVATNVKNLPQSISDGPFATGNYRNDTIVKNTKNGKVVFIQERFLRFVNICECCGQEKRD